MGRRKPPPRIMEPDEERRQQEFLERAAPIVLEDPVVDWHRWQMLAQLAAQLDLSTAQLRSLLEELQQRGVIREIRYEPPHPPPLPDHLSRAPAGEDTQQNDEDFRLNPPPRLDRAATSPEETSPAERQRDFHEQAAATMARFGGLTSEARLQLARIASKLGLTGEQAAEALAELRPAETSPSNETTSDGAPTVPQETPASKASLPEEEQLDADRWRIPDGEPVRPPLPPAEAFTRELDEAMAPHAHQQLDWSIQRQWLERGVTVHRLAPVFAFHLIQDAADRHDCQLADPSGRDGDAMREESITETPRWQIFLDRAAEILAEHRGLNAHSRVMLMALADELGLTGDQAQRALAWLQASDDREERRRNERRQSFRHHVQRVLDKLRRGVVTAHAMSLLVNAAHQRFGLPADEAQRLVHEVARERNMPVALRDDVERHLRRLVTESLSDNGRLERDSYQRLVAEGIRWGLPRRLTERVIEDEVECELRRRMRRRTVARWALGLASAVIVVCLCFLTWSVLENQYGLPAPELDSGPLRRTAAAPTAIPDTADQDVSWWDEELALAAARARIEFPMLRRPLQQIADASAQRRRNAYEELVDFLLNQAATDDQHKALLDLLSLCAALDPDEENAAAVMERMLQPISTPDQPLNDDPEAYEKMFLGLNGAVRILLAVKDQQARAEYFSEMLSGTTGITLDQDSLSGDVDRFCQAALAERPFRTLIATAATDAGRAKSLYPVVAAQVRERLPQALQDKLTAEFLATLLASKPECWESFQDELTRTANSPDLLAAARLIDLFETTDHAPLREFLGHAFLERAGPIANRGGITVAEVAEQIRQALGISRWEAPDERREWLTRQTASALAVSPDKVDLTVELPMMIDQLGRLSVMACALAQGESGWPAFDQLRNNDRTLTAPAETGESPSESPVRVNRRVNSIERTLDRISHPRSGPASRAIALQSIADQVDEIPDLPPRDAERLAAYLLRQKTIEEHRRVVATAPRLARWKSLKLAIADGLSSATITQDRLQSLVAALLGKDVDVEPGPGGKQAVQLLLLKSVLENLGRKPSAAANPWNLYDQLKERIAERYRLTAGLLHIPTDGASGEGPTPVLTTLITGYRGQSDTGGGAGGGKSEWRHRLRAVQYAATDDLQRTVALQDLWLETVAASLVQRHPKGAEQVAAITKELAETVRHTDHIANQLYANCRAELRLWLLAMEYSQ